MGSVTIRNLNEAVKRNARLAAAVNGRSLEAELRALLEKTYGVGPTSGETNDDWVSELIRIANGAGEGVFDDEPLGLREIDL